MERPEFVLSLIERLVEQDQTRYQQYLVSIERLFVASMVETDMSEQVQARFNRALQKTLNVAAQIERKLVISQTAEAVAGAGLETVDAKLVGAATLRMQKNIVTQMMLDAIELRRHFQRVRTTAYLISEARPMGEAHAMRLAYLQNEPLIQHVFVDRRGRKWKSSSYVRTAFRYHYLELLNDLEVVRLAHAGAQSGALVHPNGRRVLFGLAEGVGQLGWPVVKAQHLHPNSNALVQPVPGDAR